MKKSVLFPGIICIVLIHFSGVCFSQQRIDESLATLKSYEATYESKSHKRLEFAASPVDTVLWAVLGKSR